MDLKLAGKIVLTTGSSRGTGLATAKAFAAEGCRTSKKE
jgi:NAD(P)-dependent dehydrogenase (short-subunit alcohol dehydrogenase family)